ncbi:zinc metalloproteinase [Lactobacillus sp.]|uniref:zinc metalloproteinase n=1 Tax=Lactobacillus sp. TaxID=1591 RepID=UPI003EF243B7
MLKKNLIVVASALALFGGVATPAFAAKKTTISSIKTKYAAKTKSLTLTGKAKGAKTVKISYNGKAVKKAAVSKKGTFKAKVKFTGYKNFTLLGQNSKGKTITKAYKVTSDKYVTSAPTAVKVDHEKDKGITYTVNTVKGATLNFYYGGKLVKTAKTTKAKKVQVGTGSAYQTTVTFTEKELTGKKGNFEVTAKTKDKKTSQKAKFAITEAGQSENINY